MADERLREMERRWRASGLPQDEAAWLAERQRRGDLGRCTVRELLRSRVWRELLERGEPGGAWEARLEATRAAFLGGEVVLLVGDRQPTRLEDEVEVRPGVEVTWLHVPRLGGA